ncbi:hypothetical protein G6F43_013995 [Rhizopus delemar]|nr:hypothetical protein G6F43_013995 [Rhizopus delemar]
MRLSLIFFGLSSVFAIVSSVPLGSIGLEKRQIGGTDIAAPAPAAAPAVATVGDITSSSPVAAIFGDIVSSYSSAVAGTGAAAPAAAV